MKRLSKNALALTLSLVLIVSTMATGLSVLAEGTIPSYYGTAEKGINSEYTAYPRDLKPADGVYNLDFENGFVYWSGSKSGKNFASDTFKLEKSPKGDNTYVTLKDTGYSGNIQTVMFKVPNVSVGDKVVLLYDVKGADAGKIVPYLIQDGIRPVEYDANTGLNISKNPDNSSEKWKATNGTPATIVGSETANSVYSVQLGAKGWTTMVTERNTRIKEPTSLTTSATSDIYLQVCIGRTKSSVVPEGTVLDVAIDNIRLAKVEDNVYYDVTTGEPFVAPEVQPDYGDADDNTGDDNTGDDNTGDDNTGDDNGEDENEVYPPVITPPSYYGTEAEGFNSQYSSYPQALKPSDYIYNLDFEQGFIYWSGKKYNSVSDPGSLASDSYKLVDDGTNRYITLKDEGYVNTMRTALFKASNVKVGDTLVLIYDAKGADAEKLRVTLVQEHLRGSKYITYSTTTGLNTTDTKASPGQSNALVNASASLKKFTSIDSPAGWTTYITGSTATVNDPETLKDKEGNLLSKPCTSDIYLQVLVQKASGVVVGDELDVAIDNIRIAKVENGVYTDVATKKVIYDPNAVELPASSILVATLPKTEYLQGERLDLTNGALLVNYSDGTSKTINITQTMLSGYTPKKLGKQTVTVTYRGCTTTFEVNVALDPEAELSADVLVWLINIILANETYNADADFNSDGNVDILDIVYVKKQLVQIELSKTPIEGPLYAASSEDPYSGKIVRYEYHKECTGWYFTPKAEGTYKTIILIHGNGGADTFKNNLLSTFNYWVKNGYIEPMVVIIPEIYNDDQAGKLDTIDFQNYMYSPEYEDGKYATKANRFNLLLKNILNGNLSSKIDTTKSPLLAGFSMGGTAALHGGVQYNDKIEKVGALSPSTGFYLGDGKHGIYNYASDMYFSESKSARVYLSAGKAEDSGGFVAIIDKFDTAIKVNNPDIITKYKAQESWGGHAWALAQKEIFMFVLFATQNDRLPTEAWVETACNSISIKTPTVVYSAADEHK